MHLYLIQLLVSIVLCQGMNINSLKLKQVMIISRHNIRAPMETDLQRNTPKKWQNLYENPGYLTQKGALLEGYMGDYFSEWFKSQIFFTEKCPSEDEVYVYANSVNRTIKTAKAFVESAFRGCKVTVNHIITNNTEEMDPNFELVVRSSGPVHNNPDALKTMVFDEIIRTLDKTKLNAGLSLLNTVLKMSDSEICQTKSLCDLTDKTKNIFLYEIGRELLMEGPLAIALSVTDSFIMSYYDGLPMEDIAWGLVTEPEKWKLMTEVGRECLYIRHYILAKYVRSPFLEMIASLFLENNMPKVTIIVGHDYNQMNIFYAMGFKEIRWPNQFQDFPIGGKIVFQRWANSKNDYLKIEYIYASSSQLRNGTKFTAENPPQRVLLELKWCNVDENGFCPWNEFISKLRYLNL